MLTKTAGLLFIVSVFAFACGKEENEAPHNGASSTSVQAKAVVANAGEVGKNLLVMQYYALPG